MRQGRLILVAEDQEVNRTLILRQLALSGYAADVEGDGQRALERWRSGDYALLLTDLHMPEMDGYELAARIRAEERSESPRRPIIALTATVTNGEAERCLETGMDDCLSKPMRVSELKAMLGKWLGQGLPSGVVFIAPAVDLDALKEAIGNDPKAIRKLLVNFKTTVDGLGADLQSACLDGEASRASGLAHQLKAPALWVGAKDLGAVCAEIEAAGRAAQAGPLRALKPRLDAELARVTNYLESL